MILENSFIPYANTSKSRRQKKFNEGAMKAVQNKIASNKILMEEAEELKSEQMKNLTRNFKLANGKGRRDKIREQANFKRNKKDQLFKESVYDVFYNALPLDEEFKGQYEEKLQNLVENVVSVYMEENHVSLRDLSKRNEILEALINLCEETADEMTKKEYSKKKILNEEDEEDDEDYDDEEIDSELDEYDDVDVDDDELVDDDDELQEAHNAEKEAVTQSLAEEIKQKVIDTVQQEKDTARELQQEKEDIKETIEATSDEVDPSDSEMEDEDMAIDPETGTPTATTAGDMAGKEIDYDNSTDSEEVKADYTDTTKVQSAPATKTTKTIVESGRIVTMRRKKMNTDSLYKNIMTSVANKSVKQSLMAESSSVEVNMDIVMAESLMLYTLLETLSHMNIIESRKSELKKFSEALVHLSK